LKYTVTVRGPLPLDIGRKLVEAHAAAVKASPGAKSTTPRSPTALLRLPETPGHQEESESSHGFRGLSNSAGKYRVQRLGHDSCRA